MRKLIGSALLSLAMVVVLPGGTAAAATLVNDSFATDSVEGAFEVGGFTGFGGSGTPYSPCLTASADLNLRPVPGCVLGGAALKDGPDPSGGGALRLTDDQRDRAAYLIAAEDLPMNAGLDISFHLFAYHGLFPELRGADGTSFFLQDASVPITHAGAFGGSLGYAQKVAGTEAGVKEDVHGVEGAYVGLGFDEFGNFANDNEGRGHGCGTPPGPDVHGLFPDHVSLRGPGEGIDGYCLLQRTSVAALGGIDDAFARHRDADGVRRDVHIVIDPLDKPDARIRVTVDFHREDGSTVEDEVLDDPLPADRPARVRFGFAASTGSLTNVHEIRGLRIRSIEPLPELRIAKSDDGPFEAGGSGSFKLSVSVHGDEGAALREPVTVRDRLPGGAVVGAAGGEGWSCGSPAAGELTCTFVPASPLPVGSKLPPIAVPVSFSAVESCTYENEATVESADNASGPADSTASDPYAVRPVGVADTATYALGHPLEIPLLANDLGSIDPASVKVTPARHGTAVWEPGRNGGVLVYTPGAGALAAEHLTYTATDACGQEIPPTPVEIHPPPPPPPGASADLEVSKEVTPVRVQQGGVLAYTIAVRNRGPSPATDVVFTDAASGRAELLGLSSDRGSCERQLPIVCRLGTLAPGAMAHLRVRLRPLEAGAFANTGAATATSADPDPGNDSSTARAEVRPRPARLTLRKRATRGTLAPGRTVAFVIAVGARPGPDARDVRVCDRVPKPLEIVVAPGAERSGRRICWAIDRLAGGATRRLQFLARLRRAPRDGVVRNVAVAGAANAAPRRASADVLSPTGPPPTTG
ncbi:MAG TPA: hypothetical protein VHA54_06960 [Solirubrobacterales bacterium]|nr:hypothetical protein [Solirubrobacterales bacterium]